MDEIRLGVVRAFDAETGLGTVTADGDEAPFHCTAIVDGSRRIEPATRVAFVLGPGHGGRFEAHAVTKLEPVPPS